MCNEYSLTEAARGFIANTGKYISVPINHLSSFYSLLKLVRRTVKKEVDSATQQCQSQSQSHFVSKVSSLDLSERGRREIGDGGKARGRGGKQDERERTWESRRAKGGMVRKAKLSKRKRERVDCKCESETVRRMGVEVEEQGENVGGEN